MCSAKWQTREVFLADPNLAVTGYMANFDRLELGIFLLDHMTCGTTLAIQASQFLDLYDGPVFTNRRTGTGTCPGCLDFHEGDGLNHDPGSLVMEHIDVPHDGFS